MGCSVGLKYAKNALAAGSAPDHDAPPGLLVGWGGGHPLPTPRRLRRFDSRAFGASILVPPV